MVGIIVILLLIPAWYAMFVPSIMASEIEKVDTTTSLEGTLGEKGYILTFFLLHGVWKAPISIKVHSYVKKIKGDNVTLIVEINMTRIDTGETIPPPFSRNLTYVFNKFTRENVPDAPEEYPDVNRTGYDPLYPLHLKAGENIPNAWLEFLNTTATLEFKEIVKEEGVTLYKYFVNKTITKMIDLPGIGMPGPDNYSLTFTKTILIEPLSGLPAYIENETFSFIFNPIPPYWLEPTKLIRITYKSTPEAKAQGIANAKAAHDGIQLLELYIPSLMGVVAILLTVCLAFDIRRLERKKSLEPKTRSPASI